jgi:hypothetical protein
MTPERWRQIEQLYHSALNRGTDELADFLEKSCGGDEALRQEVEALLANEGEAKGFIEAPALEAAAPIRRPLSIAKYSPWQIEPYFLQRFCDGSPNR